MKKLIKKGQKGIYVPSQSNFLQKVKDFWNAPHEYKQVPIYNRLGGNPEDIKAQIQQDVQNSPTQEASFKEVIQSPIETAAWALAPEVMIPVQSGRLIKNVNDEGITGANILDAVLLGLPIIPKNVKLLKKKNPTDFFKNRPQGVIGNYKVPDSYNGSSAMTTSVTAHGNPLTAYDIFEESGPVYRMKSNPVQTGPFFEERPPIVDWNTPYAREMSPEELTQMTQDLGLLGGRQRRIEKALLTGRTKSGKLLDETARNVLTEELGRVKTDLSSIRKALYRGRIPTSEPTYVSINTPTSSFKIPEAPPEISYVKTKIEIPEPVKTSTTKVSVQKSTLQNNEGFSRKENDSFKNAAAEATGDMRHGNQGRPRFSRARRDDFIKFIHKPGNEKLLKQYEKEQTSIARNSDPETIRTKTKKLNDWIQKEWTRWLGTNVK